jgi:hypothetical protein
MPEHDRTATTPATTPATRTTQGRTQAGATRQALRNQPGLAAQQAALRPGQEPILYVGMNEYSADELRTLQQANANRGGVTGITPSKDPDKVKVGATTHDLSSTEALPAFLQAVGIPADRQQPLVDLLAASQSNARDELGQLVRILNEAETGRRSLNRVVFSGHSVGSVIWGDGNGSIDFGTMGTLWSLFPKAARQVQDLMLSACYTGGEATMDQYHAWFPSLQTIWAYAGSSPGTWSGAMDHMKVWERTTRGQDPATIAREGAQGTHKGENVATWDTKRGYRGGQPVSLEDARRGVEMYDADFQDAFSGAAEVQDPQRGPLREYYNAVQRVLAHPETDAATRAQMTVRRDTTIRLLFYRLIRGKFAAAYGTRLKAGYDEAHVALPAFAELPRRGALAAIEAFGAQASGAKGQDALQLLQKGLRDLDPALIPATWV